MINWDIAMASLLEGRYGAQKLGWKNDRILFSVLLAVRCSWSLSIVPSHSVGGLLFSVEV